MVGSIPYIFCRYGISIDEEPLDAVGQASFFGEGQGQPIPYLRRGSAAPDSNVTVTEVEKITVDGARCLSAMVGLQPGIRTIVGITRDGTHRTRATQRDSHFKFSHVVLIPDLGLMAVQDRSNDLCIPARTTIRILRSIVRGSNGELDIIHLTDGEVRNAVNTWELTQYQYTVRPLNPVSLSDLTNERSDRMKAENVARETGALKAKEGQTMHAAGGTISQTQEMVDVGYGQNGFRGFTPDGHLGHVPKPAFHMDKAKNLRERDKPRFLRIMFEESDDGEAALAREIAASLLRFYVPDDEAA